MTVVCYPNMGAHKKRSLQCETCHREFLGRDEPNHRARFCSHSCASRDPYAMRGIVGKAGSDHPRWKGGLTKSTRGYWYVKLPGHHRADKQGYVKRADLALEEKIGRPLERGELAHHINSDKEDDRHENLELHTVESHNLLHAARLRKPRGPKRHPPPFVPIERILELRVSGYSLRWIGREVGLNHETVRQRLLLTDRPTKGL